MAELVVGDAAGSKIPPAKISCARDAFSCPSRACTWRCLQGLQAQEEGCLHSTWLPLSQTLFRCCQRQEARLAQPQCSVARDVEPQLHGRRGRNQSNREGKSASGIGGLVLTAHGPHLHVPQQPSRLRC